MHSDPREIWVSFGGGYKDVDFWTFRRVVQHKNHEKFGETCRLLFQDSTEAAGYSDNLAPTYQTWWGGGVGLAGSTVRGSNRGVGKTIRTRPDRPRGPPNLPYNWYRVSFPGVKRPGLGFNLPPTSSDKVKERVEV